MNNKLSSLLTIVIPKPTGKAAVIWDKFLLQVVQLALHSFTKVVVQRYYRRKRNANLQTASKRGTKGATVKDIWDGIKRSWDAARVPSNDNNRGNDARKPQKLALIKVT